MTSELRPNKEVVKKWVDNLRSGEYSQGKGQLEDNGCFCCLGVLCDMAVRENVIPSPNFQEGPYGSEKICYENEWQYLPDKVREWAGLTSGNPMFSIPSLHSPVFLSDLNDDHGFTFEMLADLIEKEYLGE